MTDQIPADKVRDLRDQYARLIEDAGTKETQAYYGHVVKDLDALLPAPPLPTLADMTEEERAACQWMQADVAGHSTRYVILDPSDEDGEAELIDPDGRLAWTLPDYVTPRPDLPRMEWPGTENPAPALPDGWRLADHPEHGRVIVANAIPGRDGHIHYVFSSDRYPTGLDWHHCTPDALTYLDQEAEDDTPEAVPPNTLAVGSEWDDADALEAACAGSWRTQITVIDRDGDVSVWDASAENWHGPHPIPKYAPFTITHTGREDDQ